MTDEGYNGWKNRETWAFMLHVNNDEGLYSEARELVAEARRTCEYPFQIADALKDWAETLLTKTYFEDEFGAPWPDGLAMMASDVGSLWRIDWQECVDSILSDLPEDDDEDGDE